MQNKVQQTKQKISINYAFSSTLMLFIFPQKREMGVCVYVCECVHVACFSLQYI